jgi:hypothetical protein
MTFFLDPVPRRMTGPNAAAVVIILTFVLLVVVVVADLVVRKLRK